MSIKTMKQALKTLKDNRRTHYGCEDAWYSCPKHEDGCFNDFAGDECNCGADKANIQIDLTIASLTQAIEQANHFPNATKMMKPVCPYCKVEMTPINFEGYYESFSYWACDCETLPDAETGYGNYCGC